MGYSMTGSIQDVTAWVSRSAGLNAINAAHVVCNGVSRDVFEFSAGRLRVPAWVGLEELLMLATTLPLDPRGETFD